MKKILVVLLVLAVAGGVFAQQGEWTLSGGAVVGAHIDLDPNHGVLVGGEKEPAAVVGAHYNSWDPQNGNLTAAYNLEGLKAYVTFTTKVPKDKGLVGGIEYNGDRYALKAEANFMDLLYNGGGPERLWGYYKLLDELIHLEAAYKSRWNEWWVSDQTAGIVNVYAGGTVGYGIDAVVNQGPWDGKNTWGRVDGHTFLLANVELSSFNFGIKVPVLFKQDGSFYDGYKLVDDALLNSVVGLKFGLDVVEFAAQFIMQDYGIYFGGKAFAGPVTVGLSFMGILGEKNTAGEAVGIKAKFGGRVEYAADSFSAWASGFYGFENVNATTSSTSQIGVEPGFFYNVIPTHLRFQTDVGFYFYGYKEGGVKVIKEGEDAIIWAVRPQLFWNFLGTGAGNFDGINTGMIVRYTLISGDRQNTLDAVFKWSF